MSLFYRTHVIFICCLISSVWYCVHEKTSSPGILSQYVFCISLFQYIYTNLQKYINAIFGSPRQVMFFYANRDFVCVVTNFMAEYPKDHISGN